MRYLFTILALLFLPSLAGAAGEIKATDAAGKTLYALIINANSQEIVGTTPTTLAGDGSNYVSGALALTEITGTGFYRATFPAVGAGRYAVLVYRQAGGAAAVGDTLIQQGAIDWTGSGLVGAGNAFLSAASATVVASSVQAARALPYKQGNLINHLRLLTYYPSGTDPSNPGGATPVYIGTIHYKTVITADDTVDYVTYQ